MAKKIKEDKLKAIIVRELTDAKSFQRSDIEKSQRRALDYYDGKLTDTPPEEGWSKVVSKDASDVIGWVLPGIMRIFMASDRIVDFQPAKRGDEAFTDQASDTINYDFWASTGYRVLYDACHDGLLLGDGIVKTWWDDTKEYETSIHSGLTAEDIAVLKNANGLEIVEQKDGEPFEDYVEGEPVAGPDGQMMPGEPQLVEVPTFDVKLRRVISTGRLRFRAIPRGDFFMDRDAITIPESRFCSHRDPRTTRSKLLLMGFDKAKVASIPKYDGTMDPSQDDLTRNNEDIGTIDAPDDATEFIELHEIYLQMDCNGDGVAERIRAYYAGNAGGGVLLDWEEYDDEVPFDQIPCTPVPHRFASDSLANDVVDVQQIKTVLLRQGLNNAYQVNNPQKVVEQDSINNLDELLNPTVGGVLYKKKNTAPVQYNVVPPIMSNVLETIGLMDRTIEMRTGISRQTMALDPEALQNQTATASQNQRDAAYSQTELIARNMAELGWKLVFKKALRITVKHQDRARTIRLRDKWVEVDPRAWNADMDAIVNTGLGTGSRDRDQMMLANVNAQQEKIATSLEGAGLSDLAVDMMVKMIDTAIKSAEAAGLRNAADYFIELDEDKIAEIKKRIEDQAGQPPPEVQMQQEKAKAELELKQQKQQADAALQAQQMQINAQLEREKMAQEAQLRREQMAMEMQMRQQQIQAEIQLKRETAFFGNAMNGSGLSPVQLGGNPG